MKQALAEISRIWWQRLNWHAQTAPTGREKTLRELMAERGLDENGRTLATAAREQKPVPPRPVVSKAIFVAEFTYDAAHLLTVSVVDLSGQELRGRCHQSGKLELFSLNKVRGLIKIVDSGEMLTPSELVDRYL
ncbi:MAG: hypothetical protein NDI93_11840 [Pseudomonas sp.]|nr:hypothetical protein [Pseudomonas sp.]